MNAGKSLEAGTEGVVHVALTRENGKNGALRSALNRILEERKDSSGAERVELAELPCIEHAAGPDLDRLERTLASASELSQFEWILITSPESANVFAGAWTRAGKSTTLPKIAAVGDATSRALDSAGVSVGFVPSVALGEKLAEELPLSSSPDGDRASVNRVLYPASARAKKTVEKGLHARGFEVTRWNVYDTVAAKFDDEMKGVASTIEIGSFASPSAVSAWFAEVGSLPAFCACIGKTSAQRCLELGAAQDSVIFPAKPGVDSWATSVMTAVDRYGTPSSS
eukprot:CAMPEP_0185850434 /NCGR_PEP_ID=MMETSP1354-20130828/4572_1 /TAXON_ID=708628 /ORGANISM="Erythrolobus madagascarensis, Strain CCMP3276" /LENGTH=282 /DNA_ID=CAMNT_0028551111 /DNA_START=65 /DNA_END=913 /DNA_ORIENTATION=+